jgi:PPM family protein phosphatase
MALLNLFRRKPNPARTDPSCGASPVEPAPAPDPRPPFVVRSFGMSDRGQARTSNEDRFAVVELARTLNVHHTNLPQATPRSGSHRGHAFLVADGVGGHEAGEVASAVAVEAVEDFLLDTLKRFSNLQAGEAANALAELKGALLHAEARLVAEAAKRPEWRGMGTTLTLAFAVNWALFIAHAGDSRCYVLSEGGLRQVTRDHTLAAELVRHGVLPPGGEARHPYRRVLDNLLSGGEPGVRVELHWLDLHPDDVLLLCSDGLTGMVPDDRIAVILREEPDPRRACERLVAEANRHGGDDNITAIVAHVGGPANQSEAASAEAAPLTPGG